MQSLLLNRVWKYSSAFFIFLSLGCSLTSGLTSEDSSVSIPPTRTRLPTFTPTPLQQPVSILPTSTPEVVASPTPPPTQAPPIQAPPTNTPVPESTATNTPEPPPPAEAAAPAPAPTEPPPPPESAASAVGPNGVIGKIEFRDGRNTYAVGEKVFVRIEAATENEAGQISFGILGLTTSTGAFQTSWSNGSINGKFTHEDGVAFGSPGVHKLWLSICFSPIEVCQGPDGNWERFEPGLDVIIQ